MGETGLLAEDKAGSPPPRPGAEATGRPHHCLELNHRTHSTYLGHLVDAEQPGQLQAQHLEAGLRGKAGGRQQVPVTGSES